MNALFMFLLGMFLMIPAAWAEAERTSYVAIIPADGQPTYYRDARTGNAAGFSVDIMNEIGKRAGFSVTYSFGKNWDEIIRKVESGEADIIPCMGISKDRHIRLDFSSSVDAFPVSFFTRKGLDWNRRKAEGRISVGVIKSSIAFEKLRESGDSELVLYETFTAGLFDLLAGKIDAFACPAPILWKLAQESGMADRIMVVDRPVAEIKRAIAVREGNQQLLNRINTAVDQLIGSPEYQRIYAKWYGAPVPFWTVRRLVISSAVIMGLLGVSLFLWRYYSLAVLNTRLERTIAERDQALNKASDYAAALKRSNTELELYASISSHDLQEPLRSVVSFTELLQQRYGSRLDQDAERYLSYIIDGVSRIRTQIRDLLAYSRLDDQEANLQSVDMSGLLEGVLADMAHSIRERAATITRDRLPTLRMNGEQMASVFQNLIGNAILFRGAESPRIHISASEGDREWTISVRDNGLGIEPEYFDRIFIMFQRLHARTAYAGNGIGLAICKKIVERHGGRIWVESEPGKGSVFHFTISK